ncbi:MAG TPA: efflux RND transporter periplasmic adaptor subunit [Terriglobales bacterium]|nr:efflux RND transporter periplasmic adaptor subunit [Terriglobales bacterium]
MEPTDTKDSEEAQDHAATGAETAPRKRRLRLWIILFGAVLLAGAGVFTYSKGTLFGLFRIGPAATQNGAKDVYYCPMHKDYKSDKPGNCPICSMKLVKQESSSSGAGNKDMASMPGMKMEGGAKPQSGKTQDMPGMPGMKMDTSSGGGGDNTIFVPPERQQLIGVKSVPAVVKSLSKEIRTIGKVSFDETKLTHIHTKVTGYIDEVFVDYVGKVVKRGDPLFTIYSPDLVSTQEEYLLALKSKNVLKDPRFPWISDGSENLLAATKRRLQLWDVTDQEIRDLEKEGKVKRALTIYSPVSGVVTERAAYHHGRFVNPEMDLYTIVDLSTVWVRGQVYEYELPFVKVGQVAEVDSPYADNVATRRGKVVYLSPFLDPQTRTAEVRLEFPNPDMSLRPDSFLNFKLRVPLQSSVVVPQDAVLDTGTEQYVFVDKGDGYFEPRLVKVSAQAAGESLIVNGLKAGERVVTAANFILDSESRLRGVFANMGKPSTAPAAAAAATQNIKVDILEPKQAKVGANTLRLAVRDSSGKPIVDAEVGVRLFMPQMGNMAPMSANADLKPAGNGEYAGTITVPMAWTWETTVTVKKGGAPVGSVRTSITAR